MNGAQKKQPSVIVITLGCFLVPRAGVEPARVAPLVFETSASTDSAIWAACVPLRGLKRCKDREFY